MEVRSLGKFSLALALASHIRPSLEPEVRSILARRLDILAQQVEAGFAEIAQDTEILVDFDHLISYHERFGSLPKGEELVDPVNSKFNFFGPLFDQYGERMSAPFGLGTISLLFLAKKQKHELDSLLGDNREILENSFQWMIRDPKDVEQELSAAFEGFFTQGKSVDFKDQLVTLLKDNRYNKKVIGPYLKKLQSWPLDSSVSIDVQKASLQLLLDSQSTESWAVLSALMEKKGPWGGNAGIAPILLQAVTEVALQALAPPSNLPQRALEMKRQRAQSALALLISAYQSVTLSAEDRTWILQGLKTYQNAVQSALGERPLAQQKYDTDYLQKHLQMINQVLGPTH